MIWFIQNIAFSVSLIVIIHYLYLYFETTLTTPKVKDLIHCPKQKYNSLFETINRKLNHDSEGGAASAATRSGLGIVNRKNNGGSDLGDDDDDNDNRASSSSSSSSSSVNRNAEMKNDLKSFLRTIGLKKQSTQPSRAPYEMN
jgi:hypothetical protein